nr:hypothetical protein [Candidatus Sigynarchaeota archaeon]
RAVLVEIKRAKDVKLAIDTTIALFSRDNRKNLLLVHRTTAELAEPRLTRRQVDELLAENYKACMADLTSMGARSPSVIRAIDGTEEQCRSKYKNGLHAYVRSAKSAAWELGYKYSVVNDVTNEFFVACIHRGSWVVDNDPKSLVSWINDIKASVARVRDAGSNVECIEADREYFSVDLFACATAGMLAPVDPRFTAPRVMTPRRFGPEKIKFTWNYLVKSTQSQVFVDHIALNETRHPASKHEFDGLFEKNKKGCYEVPYACVALIDEYRSKKQRTLDEIRAQAKETQASIDKTTRAMHDAQAEYLQYHSRKSKKPVAVPSLGRGRQRWKFLDGKEKQLFRDCMDLQRELKRLEKKKSSIISSVVFFAVSLRANEDPTRDAETFISFAKDYHSRWGIENDIKTKKHVFRRHVHGRKPIKRQLAIVQGMIIHDHWKVARKAEIMTRLRAIKSPTILWNLKRPWIRRKFGKEMSNLLSPVRFLIATWCYAITSTITDKLKDEF